MKREERHKLHTHELERLTSSAGRFFEKYGTRILFGVLAVLVAVFGLWYVLGRSGRTRAAATTELLQAVYSSERQDEAFSNFAEKSRYQGTPLVELARLNAAWLELERGVREMFQNREAGLRSLKSAREKLEAVLHSDAADESEGNRTIRERALFGLAVAQESLAGKDTSEALATYKQLLDEYPDSIYKKQASERIEALQRGRAGEFYAFFSQQTPRPEDPAAGRLPADLESLRSKLNLPPDHPPLGGSGGPSDPFDEPVLLPETPKALQPDAYGPEGPDLGVTSEDGRKPKPFPKDE